MPDVTRPCPGCSETLTYVLEDTSDYSAPELLPPSNGISYRGGHLCADCGDFVEEALAKRRRKTIGDGFVFTYANGTRRVIVSSADSAVAIWNAYIARTGHGVSTAGNGGTVADARGMIVCTISYNGRIWPARKAQS